jgi:cytochrome c oxidase subunit II
MKLQLYNSKFLKRAAGLLILLVLGFTTGCVSVAKSSPANTAPPNFMNSNSPISTQEADIYRILLYISAGVLLIVWGFLIYDLIRFHENSDNKDIVAREEAREGTIEAIYTGIPILVVIVIFIMALGTIRAVAAPAAKPTDLTVHVIGHRWWWEFDYPDLKIRTANELHVPVGVTVRIKLDSSDVIHSFWVPQLSGKTDAIPGVTNTMWLTSNNVGQFHGQCSEYCGLNHANMRFTVFVDSKADFDAWVANQQQPPPQPQGAQQQAAYTMITDGMCSMCHDLGDTGPDNATGPNLNHLISRQRFAGDVFDLNQENLHRWLEDTQAMKPGNDMDHKFTEEQINALMSYLLTLK